MQIPAPIKKRIAAGLLVVSAAAFGTWQAQEGFSCPPYIPTKGDVPTIGHGSTRYEDGTPVKLTDPPISRQRAAELAKNLMDQDAKRCFKGLLDVPMLQQEYDAYNDFCGQFGTGNFQSSGMKRELLKGNYEAACTSLLRWKFQAGRDCSKPENWGPHGCKGVWARQQKRFKLCTEGEYY